MNRKNWIKLDGTVDNGSKYRMKQNSGRKYSWSGSQRLDLSLLYASTAWFLFYITT